MSPYSKSLEEGSLNVRCGVQRIGGALYSTRLAREILWVVINFGIFCVSFVKDSL